MMIRTSILVLTSALVFVSCSSGDKKSVSSAQDAAKTAPPVAALTSDVILQKYSIAELNSAANALRVIVDASLEAADVDKGQEILGCPLQGAKAMSMTMPLKALIDQQSTNEFASYETDPKAYGNSQGFESCASNCACGVYSDIVNGANAKSLPAGSSVLHSRNKSRLAAKASRQSNESSLVCAKKQSWFCGSDLKAYLEAGVSETSGR